MGFGCRNMKAERGATLDVNKDAERVPQSRLKKQREETLDAYKEKQKGSALMQNIKVPQEPKI